MNRQQQKHLKRIAEMLSRIPLPIYVSDTGGVEIEFEDERQFTWIDRIQDEVCALREGSPMCTGDPAACELAIPPLSTAYRNYGCRRDPSGVWGCLYKHTQKQEEHMERATDTISLEDACKQPGVSRDGDIGVLWFDEIANFYLYDRVACPRCANSIRWKWQGELPSITSPESIRQAGLSLVVSNGELLGWAHRQIRVRCKDCDQEWFIHNLDEQITNAEHTQ